METGGVIFTATIVIAGTALASLVLHRSKQNLDKRFPERHRFPKGIMYLSWFAVLLGALIAITYTRDLMEQNAPWPEYLAVPLIGIFGIAGLVMLLVYRNWYITITEDTIHWRTRLLGRTHALPFEDITAYKTWESNVGPTVKVWGKDGQRVGFPLSYFGAKPLMAHLRSRPEIKRN